MVKRANMPHQKLRVRRQVAVPIVLAMAVAMTAAVSLAFSPFSFAWLAWSALGYFAIVTIWKACVVCDRNPELGPGKDLMRSNWLVCAAYILAFAATILGMFGLIELRHMLIGFAAFFVLCGLIRQTAGAT